MKPDGSYLNYSYDAASRVTVVANNTGERVEYGYNLNSDVTASTIKTTSGGSITKQMTMTYDKNNGKTMGTLPFTLSLQPSSFALQRRFPDGIKTIVGGAWKW